MTGRNDPQQNQIVLIVEPDVLIRQPLAEYLRDCGYRVIEAVDDEEARQCLTEEVGPVDAVLCDVNAQGDPRFTLANWIRKNHPRTQVIIAGSMAMAAEKAGDLCEDGPAVKRPYDHRQVLDHIRRLLAARDRG